MMFTQSQLHHLEQLVQVRKKKEQLQSNTSQKIEDVIRQEHLTIEENEYKLKLPALARLTSDEIATALRFLDAYEQQLHTIEEHTRHVLTTLQENKQRLVPGGLGEVASLILGTRENQEKNKHLNTGVELLSTWLSTRGLDTNTSKQLIDELNALLEKIHTLEDQLQAQGIALPELGSPVRQLPNLTRVEYIDLAQDIFRPAKNRGSVASLLAQTATGRKINQLRNELQQLQRALIDTRNSLIREKKEELTELQNILQTFHH